MSKGILNNRDKMIWDNTHKPDITDVVGVVDDEMDDLLEDHDDKVVDIVGDNMNDLLDAHDDKVVSIVGDNMSTLLTGAASSVQLIAGDLSGVGTTTGVKIGKWDATHDIYAKRYTGTVEAITSITYKTVDSTITNYIAVSGYLKNSDSTVLVGITPGLTHTAYSSVIYSGSSGITLIIGTNYSEGSYDFIVYYLVATE